MRLALACLLVTLGVSAAHAQEPTADELLAHGLALREDGRDEEALAIFLRANATAPTGQALAQIALAEQALGRLVDAETHLSAALASDGDRFVRRNRALLEQALDEMRTQLTDLSVSGGLPGAEVFVDGASRGTLPLPGTIRVQAGSTHVVVQTEGHATFTRDLIVSAGTPLSLEVTLEPVRIATPLAPPTIGASIESAPTPSPPRDEWMLPTGIALAAAGVVGIGIGSGLIAWREDNARARLTCSDVDPACRAHYGTAIDAEAAGVATYVVSGLLVAGGATVILLNLFSHSRETQQTFACAPGVLTLTCVGRF